jgi:predicted transcriptional regulator YdeE
MIEKIELIELDAFFVTGISVRTTNQNNQSKADIAMLWDNFMSGDVMSKITCRVSDEIYCLYTDYETGHTGPYTAVLGCRVNSPEMIPDDFTAVAIPKAYYHVYHLSGEFPDNVGKAWQHIWKSACSRCYTVDFDLYNAETAESFKETEAKIFLAVD